MHRDQLSCPLVHLLKVSRVNFKNGSDYLTKRTTQLFDEISATEELSQSSKVIVLKIFFHVRLVDGVCFQYSKVLVIFLFSQRSDFFLIWHFYPFPLFFFVHFSLWTWYIFVYQIPFVQPDSIYLPYLPTPLLGQDMTQGQFFKRSLAGLNSEYSFS